MSYSLIGAITSMMASIWLDVLDQTVRVCLAHGRSDLAQRLQQKRTQLLSPTLRVRVVGAPRQGKSQLINALINAPVCPVGANGTAVPTVVHYAETPVAALVHAQLGDRRRSAVGALSGAAGTPAGSGAGQIPRGGSGGDGRGGPAQPGEVAAVPPAGRVPVPVAELANRISTGPAGPADGALHAEVGLPRELLARGLVLVDTPGAEATSTDASPISADVVVWVADATRELSTTEVNQLARVTRGQPYVILALTKIDLVPQWRLVAERNRQQLASAGVRAVLVSVSATLRLQAARTSDVAMNTESGFPDLIARLMRYLRAKPQVLAPTSAGLLVGRVIEQLAEPLRADLSASGTSEPLARLHEAQRALDELRRSSTRWQNALADEMADLRSDIEYDLRERTRRIVREAETAFDTADPQRTWKEFQPWLEQALTEAAEANFAWLVERCDWIADRVADHVTPAGAEVLPQWNAELPHAFRQRPVVIGRPTFERFTIVQMIYTGLRGSYLGVLMLGLATALAGMPLINPFSIGAGLLFAGKSIRDEGKSLRARRQAVAKAAAQRYVDNFFLRLNKDSKDTIRWVQSLLRDHYTGLVEEIQDNIVHSLRTAKQAADADVAERDQRHRGIQQQMERLAALYERAQALTAVHAAPAVGLESRG